MSNYIKSAVPGVVVFLMDNVKWEVPNHEVPEKSTVLKFPYFDTKTLIETIASEGWPITDLTLQGSNAAELAPLGCFSPHYHGVGYPGEPDLGRSRRDGMHEIFYFPYENEVHFGVSDGELEENFSLSCAACILVAGGVIHWCRNTKRKATVYFTTMLSYGQGHTVMCV